MGPKFSNGAIVQHLAKLRAKMVEADLEDVPIPPPLKKGMTTKEPSKIYAPGNKRKKAGQPAGATRTANSANPTRITPTRRTKPKGKNIKKEDSDDESEEEPDLYDSDEEWGAPKKRAKKIKKSPVEKERLSNAGISPKTVKADSDDEDVKHEGKEGSPGMNARGRRLNYAQMDNGADEEEVIDEEKPAIEYEEGQDAVDVTPSQVLPAASEFNDLPTPEEQVETVVELTTPARPTDLAAPPPLQSQRYSYHRPDYGGVIGAVGMDFIGGGGSQQVSLLMLVLSSSLTLLQYPAQYIYNTNFNNQLGSPFNLATYPGQNWSFEGSPYNLSTQTRQMNSNYNPSGSMSAPQTPGRRQSIAMAVNYDTPPYSRNNSTVTLESNSSNANSSEAPNYSQSQAQSYAAVTAAAAGVPTAVAPSLGGAADLAISQAPSQSQATGISGSPFDLTDDVYMPGFSFGDDDEFKVFADTGFGGDNDLA